VEMLEVREIENAPEKLEPGIVYISERFKLALHLCAGGDGSEVVMPFDREENGWSLTRSEDGTVTFSPSILQGGCKHHYFIENSRVRWA
jgi:hypothetical protein